MIWHKGQWLYKGRMISSESEARAFAVTGKLSFYALPVPGGRIVEFACSNHMGLNEGRYALYKVTAKLKETADVR